MKKAILATAISLTALTANAEVLQLTSFDFAKDEYGMQGSLGITVKNTSNKEVEAYKGKIECTDPFEETVIDLSIKDSSANIKPNDSITGYWNPNMFSKANNIIMSNTGDEANFECKLTNQKIVYK